MLSKIKSKARVTAFEVRSNSKWLKVEKALVELIIEKPSDEKFRAGAGCDNTRPHKWPLLKLWAAWNRLHTTGDFLFNSTVICQIL